MPGLHLPKQRLSYRDQFAPRDGQQASFGLAQGIYLHWAPYLGATGKTAIDVSGANRHGAVTINSVTASDFWKIDGGIPHANLRSNGGTSNYVNFGLLASHKLAYPNVSLWVRRPTTGVNVNRYVLTIGAANTYFIQNLGLGGEWRFTIAGTNSVSATSQPFDEWMHLFFRYNYTTGWIYRNGVQVATAALGVSPTPNYASTERIWLGNQTSHAVDVAEVTIWNRPVSHAEICELYTGGIGYLNRLARRTITPTAGTYTASAALTLPAAVAAATCTFTPPTFTSSAGLTLPAAVAAANSSHTPPTYTSSAALDLPAAVAAANATNTPPTFTGSAALTLPPAVAAAEATSTAPTFTGSAALDLPAAIAEAAATHTPPSYTATAALDLPAAIASAEATHAGPVFTATADLDLPAIVAASEATFAISAFTATADIILPAAIAAAECQHTTPTYTATAALVLAPAVAAASATFTTPVFNCWTGLIRTPWEVYELDGDGTPEIGNGPTFSRNPASPPYFTTGILGQCLTLGREINVNAVSSFNMSGKFSIGMWANMPYEAGWEGFVQTSAIITGASGKSIQLYLYMWSATQVLFQVNGATSVETYLNIDPGQWHHYVACFDCPNSRAELYVDGTLVATISMTPTTFTGSILSCQRAGCLDQVTLAEHAWTAAELAYIYNSGAGREYSTWQRSLTLPAAIASADATSTPPVYTASAALNCPAAVAESLATFAAPVFTASAGLILPAAIAASSATFTGPVYTATVDLNLPAAIAAASATYTPITFTASAALTLAPAIASSSIAFTGPVFTAEAAIEIPAVEASAIATHSTPTVTATVAISIPALQATAIAVFSLNSALLPGDSVWVQAGPGAVSFSSTGNRSSLWVPAGPADATIQPKESD